jgi:hypothetical protein
MYTCSMSSIGDRMNVSLTERQVLMVIEAPDQLSPQTTETVKDTTFEGVKCLMLTAGLRVTMLDVSCKVLNESVRVDTIS